LNQLDSYRLFVLNSHPIQYFAPQYRRLNEEADIEVTVLYCSRQGLDAYQDDGFGGVEIEWDVPLLEGYKSAFLRNWSLKTEVGGLTSLINPSIVGILARERPDALLVHGYSHFTTLLAILSAHLLNIPVLMRGDANPLDSRYSNPRSPKNRLRWTFRKTVFQWVSAFLAIGSKNREFYLAHGAPPERIFLTPFAVDNNYFRNRTLPAEQHRSFLIKEGLVADLPVILFAGKMRLQKRALDLVKAYHRLKEKGVSCQLALVGDGEQRRALEEYVEEHSLPHVTFLGFRNQSELPAWYSVADVFVLPSEDEPWGLSVNEAMSVGVPVVVSTDVGAAYDLVEEGRTGYIFPTRDIQKLYEALARVLADPKSRQQMGTAAAAKLDAWSNEQVIDGFRRSLKKVTENDSDTR
jgi:glycosyltransferase involved in cell wall biosynthesis